MTDHTQTIEHFDAESDQRRDARPHTSMPLVVWILAAGTFLMGTTEFMIAGLLPDISRDLGVGVSHGGLLITAFAVGMILGAPAMSLATLRISRAWTLRLALAVFAIGHVAIALTDSFAIAVAARVLTAFATGAYWAVAAVVATQTAGPSARSRALGLIMGGLTLANVIGVPLGSFVGHATGWRGPFWALAALSAAGAIAIGAFIPRRADEESPSVLAELKALRSLDLWLAIAASATIMGGVLAVYTFVSPLLTDRAGVSEGLVPLALIGFGVGALIGTTAGGRFGDRYPYRTALLAAFATALTLLLLVLASTSGFDAALLIALMGVTGFAVNPIATSLAVGAAEDAPTLAAALSTSGFNLGIAGGSWLAGIALDSSLGALGPVYVGVAISSLTLIPLSVLARRGTAVRHHDALA